MANDVFANGREISCKAADGKAIACFPDVCFTPPMCPATPPGVPIPYPNTGLAKDTAKGSKKVKISRKPVMLKNKSHFKKSYGDEAGCATKKGVITSTNRGKVYFTSWSMNVKVEGKNVVRHFDMTTHNHRSMPGNTIPWLYVDTMSVDKIPGDDCKNQANNFNDKCKKHVKKKKDDSMNLKGTNDAMCADDDCKAARKCVLTPYNMDCCDGKTPHHVVPKSQFTKSGGRTKIVSTYKKREAPCICLDGHSHSVGKHGDVHTETNALTAAHPSVKSSVTGKTIDKDARWTAGESYAVGAEAVEKETGCKKECTEDQLRKGHAKMGINDSTQIRPTSAGTMPDPPAGTSSGL